jgi:predicted transcriptional regulator
MAKNVRLAFRVDDDLRKAIEEAAAKDSRTPSDWLRIAVRRFLVLSKRTKARK